MSEKRIDCEDTIKKDESLKIKLNLDTETIKEKTKADFFPCLECPMAFNKRSLLELHISIKHGLSVTYKCEQCEDVFHTSVKYKSHCEVKHGITHPYKCNTCKHSFARKSGLTAHLLVHGNNRAFSCDICSMSFNQKSSLLAHVTRHARTAQFVCQICSKAFVVKSDLTTHLRIHEEDKFFQCEYCGSRFHRKSNLARHKRQHTGERPYECSHCKKTFARAQHCKEHERIHTKEKPFTCLKCGTTFRDSGNFSHHKNVTCAMLEKNKTKELAPIKLKITKNKSNNAKRSKINASTKLAKTNSKKLTAAAVVGSGSTSLLKEHHVDLKSPVFNPNSMSLTINPPVLSPSSVIKYTGDESLNTSKLFKTSVENKVDHFATPVNSYNELNQQQHHNQLYKPSALKDEFNMAMDLKFVNLFDPSVISTTSPAAFIRLSSNTIEHLSTPQSTSMMFNNTKSDSSNTIAEPNSVKNNQYLISEFLRQDVSSLNRNPLQFPSNITNLSYQGTLSEDANHLLSHHSLSTNQLQGSSLSSFVPQLLCEETMLHPGDRNDLDANVFLNDAYLKL